MSKKNGKVPAPQRMQKSSPRARTSDRNQARWTSDDFRRCRPKRDWGTDAPAEDGKSIKEVSAR